MSAETVLLLAGVLLALLAFGAGTFVERHRWNRLIWGERCRIAARPVRLLAASDPYCPSCGHNRNTSCVSSVDDGGGRQTCQKCGTAWRETAFGAEEVDHA